MSKKKGEVSQFSAEKKTKNKGRRSLGSIIMILIIIFALVYFVVSAVKIVNLNEEKKDAEQRHQELKEEKEDLLAAYENISSPEYMERLARRDLKLIKANELLFILPEDIDKKKEEAAQDPSSEEGQNQ